MTWMTTSLTTDQYQEQVNLLTGLYRHRVRYELRTPGRPIVYLWQAGSAPGTRSETAGHMTDKAQELDPDDMLDDLDHGMGGLDFLDDREVETTKTITARIQRADLKREAISMMKREHLRDILKAKPAPGTAYHLISNGRYDFWTWIPVLLDQIGYADEFYGSTWTLNRQACTDLLALFDQAKIRKIGMLTGLYFKRRETAVYAKLMTGLTDRRQRYVCLENHAKVTLLANHQTGDYLTVEGSANYTANPRIEQYVISNDRTVYDFHRAWMEEALTV